MSDAALPPLLEMRGIVKSFPGVQALRGVDLTLAAGEVLALLGENGAGKSTLMRILGGAQQPDAGTIRLDGKELKLPNPHEAQQAGVAVIYQEFNLVPGLTAAENIFLGRELSRFGFVDRAAQRQQAEALFQRLGVVIDPDALCRDLSVAQQQIVEIAKALAIDARILVMDEPSAALTIHEVERLYAIIRDLKSLGIGVIYISHRLEEIFAICDRVTVLRDGANACESRVDAIVRGDLIRLMVGRELKDEYPKRDVKRGEVRLSVKGLCRGRAVRDLSFDVHGGEVLAITGLIGAGRTEAMRLIFGADRADAGEIKLDGKTLSIRHPRDAIRAIRADAGEIKLDGKTLSIRHPRDAIRAGLGLLTEDRKGQGLVLAHSVRDNFGLPNLNWLAPSGFVRKRAEREAFASQVENLHIKVPTQETRARDLSGGNQQKVVLAKWLARKCDVLIFDEPTRGVDVGAKFEIYQLINELAGQGKAIVIVSSEMPEVLGMADRVLVMHEGRLTGQIADARSATQEQIMELAVA